MLTGGIAGVLFMGWLSFKAQFAIASGHMQITPKQLMADDCPYLFNVTTATTIATPTEEIFPLYEISYMWYTFFAAMFTIIVALLSSVFIFGWNDPKEVSPELITPLVRKKIFNETEIKIRSPANNKDTEF